MSLGHKCAFQNYKKKMERLRIGKLLELFIGSIGWIVLVVDDCVLAIFENICFYIFDVKSSVFKNICSCVSDKRNLVL